MLQRTLVPCLFPVVWFLAGCQSPDRAPSNQVPLHDAETISSGHGAAPVDLKVYRIDGPAVIGLGDAWTLRAEARDPEGQPLTFRWSASAGTLSQVSGAETVWIATEEVGGAEIGVQAIDPAGNAVGADFRVNVSATAPISPVEDVYDNVGYYCSLAIDSSNNPRITYYDQTHPSLRYAAWDGSQWKFETVEGYGLDVGGSAGTFSSMALDKAGGVHVSYLTQYASKTGPSLNYAYRSGGKWTITTLDDAGRTAYFSTTLKLNPATGKPEILYQSADNKSVVHIACTGECTSSAGWTRMVLWTETRGSDSSKTGLGNAYPGGFFIASNGTRYATFDARYRIYNNGDYDEVRYAVNSGSWDV
jgi:hypothetical protein